MRGRLPVHSGGAPFINRAGDRYVVPPTRPVGHRFPYQDMPGLRPDLTLPREPNDKRTGGEEDGAQKRTGGPLKVQGEYNSHLGAPSSMPVPSRS
jgi:hypothetical protein